MLKEDKEKKKAELLKMYEDKIAEIESEPAIDPDLIEELKLSLLANQDLLNKLDGVLYKTVRKLHILVAMGGMTILLMFAFGIWLLTG
ncbi:MAG TPA: hypothetical protein VMW42_09240 [Desulfatiglandales bacterium]|nr:hypothetical protein [Desulfatiglandales bacterium]